MEFGGGKSNAKDKSPKTDNYEDDFEEIEEDLPDQMDLAGLGGEVDGRPSAPRIGDIHGITVSQSLGIDPSVDSLQLEEYDHIEEVDKVN